MVNRCRPFPVRARRFVQLALLGASAVGATACGESASEGARPPAVIDAAALLAAPAQLESGSTSLSLEVDAWRSFQPSLDTIPRRLIAIIRVHATGGEGSAGVPGALGLDAVWLVRGTEVVRGEAREEQPRQAGARTVEFVLRDGPLWPPGDSIDVVTSVSGVGTTPRLLRAPRVAIARVD